MSRLSDLLARLLGQPQGQSEPAERSRPARGSSSARPPGRRAERGSRALAGPAAARASGPGGDAAPAAQEPRAPHPDEDAETTSGLTLDRMETMITDTMGYGVQRHAESGHPCLLGTWDSYPFVIEIPEGHESHVPSRQGCPDSA